MEIKKNGIHMPRYVPESMALPLRLKLWGGSINFTVKLIRFVFAY